MFALWALSAADNQEAVEVQQNKLSVSDIEPDKPTDEIADGDAKLEKKMNMGVGGYQVIPNFMVSHGAKKVEVNNREGCENVCDQHKDCHSFSYRAGDKRCFWSTYALHYDSKFAFFMKITKMDDMGRMKATGKYKRFDNIAYHEKGWRKLVSDQSGCEDLCNKMNRCGAYSYREYDQLCMMSGDSVKFDTDFTYYERNMPPPTDKKEMMLLEGKDDEEDVEKIPPAVIKESSLAKAARIITKKAQLGMKKIKKEAKEMEGEQHETDDTEAREERMRQQMSQSMIEREHKNAEIKKIENLNSETGRIKGKAASTAAEAREKATSRVQNAFQEGYKKAEAKNREPYEQQIREISTKGRKSMEEHTGKIDRVARMMEKKQKEKEKKETTQKEVKAKATETELKAKAVRRVKISSLKRYAADHVKHQTLRAKNEDKLKRILVIAEKRRKREKVRKELKIKKIALEKKKKQEKKVQDEKERKEKVTHEANVKEEERKHVEYARKRKEQSHKEIDKKEQIHKRKMKAEELKAKLEQAKRDAAELSEKHKEREAKIGQCEERRVKGQFVTYAYARTTTFTSAMSPSEKYGSEAEYNGMLRIQNGLGNKKQHAYLKFSANGNKIVDEDRDLMLGESNDMQEHIGKREVSPEAAVIDTSNNIVANAANDAIIQKSKAEYVARRRWVDRRRRWSVEPVVPDRRRDALASRRRELTERRRRSLTALETGVRKAVLKVFKFGGPAAKLVVKAVNCGWERSTLDYKGAAKLAVPESFESLRRELFSQSLLGIKEGEAQQLSAEDSAQTGYWGQRHNLLGDSGDDSRRRAGPSGRPPPVLPIPVPYTPDRRRYIDRRRRFPEPKARPGEHDPTAPPPSARRRRFVGQTAGTVYVPEGNNIWVSIALSANIIGVMRAADKMCFEVTGGGPTEPVILGSERSTNKPYLQLNVMGQSGARRRRCSQVVALEALTTPTSSSPSTTT